MKLIRKIRFVLQAVYLNDDDRDYVSFSVLLPYDWQADGFQMTRAYRAYTSDQFNDERSQAVTDLM